MNVPDISFKIFFFLLDIFHLCVYIYICVCGRGMYIDEWMDDR